MKFLSPAGMSEANQAFRELASASVTTPLLTIVRDFIQAHKARVQSAPFGLVFDEFMQAKKFRSVKYLDQLRKCKLKFEPLAKVSVSDLEPKQLERILRTMSSGYANTTQRYVRAILNWAIKKGYLQSNPVLALDFVHRPRTQIQVLSNEVVSKMLNHALRRQPRLLPYLLVTIFAGVRSEGEAQRLTYADVRIGEKVLVIPGHIAKTKQRRVIDLSDNFIAWWNAYLRLCEEAPKPSALIMNYDNPIHLRTARRLNWKAAVGPGIKYTSSITRHTWASNKLAYTNNIGEVTVQGGWQNASTLFRHYHAMVSKESGSAFWNIMPPG